jgi:hypothetical protein
MFHPSSSKEKRIMDNSLLKTLYRPVGIKELKLIHGSGMKNFPPRLPGQPPAPSMDKLPALITER